MRLNELLSTVLMPANSQRGMHWHAGMYTSMSPAMLGELQTISKITKQGWFKVLGDGTSDSPVNGPSEAQLCLAAIDQGLSPVYRMWGTPDRRPNQGHRNAMRWLANNIGRGKRVLVEFSNEPDLKEEWSNQNRPSNWLEIATERFIEFAGMALKEGCMPVFPAMASGVFNPDRPAGYWDPTAKNPFLWVKQAGITEFIVGSHNYHLNHPGNYPYDRVNQTGAAIEDWEWLWPGRFTYVGELHPMGEWMMNRLVAFAWDVPEGRFDQVRAAINAQRARDLNTGDGIIQDDSCWLACIIQRRLLLDAGLSHVPIIGTENGPVHGDRQDGRYWRHTFATMVLEIAFQLQFMRLFPWMIGVAPWLYGQEMLSGGTTGWQDCCWRTNRLNDLYNVPGMGLIAVANWLMNRPLSYDALGFPEAAQMGLEVPAMDWSQAQEFLADDPELSDIEVPVTEPEEPVEEEPVVIVTPLPAYFNDADDVGVEVVEDAEEPGETFWMAQWVHRLTKDENGSWPGMHSLFVDVRESGVRVMGSKVRVTWPMSGAVEERIVIIDKPEPELYGADIPIYPGMEVSMSVFDEIDSDLVTGVRSDNPRPGEDYAHVSHAVKFTKQQRPTGTVWPPPVITPQSIEEIIRNTAVNFGIQTGCIPYNPDTAIWELARRENLGAALTKESGDHNDPPDMPHDDGLTYRWQKFALGIVFVPIGCWDQAKVLRF